MERSMQHQSLDQIKTVATIAPADKPSPRATRRERLRRLAAVLEKHAGPVRLLSQIEYLSRDDRKMLRCDLSPLALAFQDAELRRDGLASDRLGDGMTFFGLSGRQAHHLFCDCHYGASVDTQVIASRVRSLAARVGVMEFCAGIWSRMRAA
jgi:hypothetical protein